MTDDGLHFQRGLVVVVTLRDDRWPSFSTGFSRGCYMPMYTTECLHKHKHTHRNEDIIFTLLMTIPACDS